MKRKFLLILILIVVFLLQTSCDNPAGPTADPPPDKSTLITAINTAEALLANTVVSNDAANVWNDFYFVGDQKLIDDFKEEIDAAVEVRDDSSASQAAINGAAATLNEAIEAFTDTDIRKPGTNTPIDKISHSVSSGTYNFGSLEYGYNNVESPTITVTNYGNRSTGDLTISLSGPNAASFTLSETVLSSIGKDGTDTFTIVPNTSLDVGDYTATVTVEGINDLEATFSVSFTVNPKRITEAALTVPVPQRAMAIPTVTSSSSGFAVTSTSWLENDVLFTGSSFRGGYVYKAYITLTANTGHTFEGINPNFVTVNAPAAPGTPAAVVEENNGTTLILSYSFPETRPEVVINLELDDFEMSGQDAVVNMGPFVLDRGNRILPISLPAGMQGNWSIGSIPLGSGNNITLHYSQFNIMGNYTISVNFIHSGSPWIVNIELEVIPPIFAGTEIVIDMEEFTMSDHGLDINLGPFTLTNTNSERTVIITGVNEVKWMNGSIVLPETGNSIILQRTRFNTGTHTISARFYHNNAAWLVNITLNIE